MALTYFSDYTQDTSASADRMEIGDLDLKNYSLIEYSAYDYRDHDFDDEMEVDSITELLLWKDEKTRNPSLQKNFHWERVKIESPKAKKYRVYKSVGLSMVMTFAFATIALGTLVSHSG